MNIWLVSREYAGIAEAGGVKNVVCSLCEELVHAGQQVTCFIPLYGCTVLDSLNGYKSCSVSDAAVSLCGQKTTVSFDEAYTKKGVRIVFVRHSAFNEKKSIYTYTEEDEKRNPDHVRGTGYKDAQFLNILFQKAVILYGLRAADIEDSPDIIHCQDATAAMLPALLHYNTPLFFEKTKCAVTIHNAGPCYHHEFDSLEDAAFYTELPREILTKGANGRRIEPFLLAAGYAELTTVSPEYAKELLDGSNSDTDGLSQEFVRREIHITGITNGIDYSRYDPHDTKKSLLPFTFDPEKDDIAGKYKCRNWFLQHIASRQTGTAADCQPFFDEIKKNGWLGPSEDSSRCIYFSYHGRIVHQKGIDILAASAEDIMQKYTDVRFIAVGQGEQELEDRLARLAEEYSGQCIYFKGYNRALSRLCTAVSDFIVLPSIFEPCGLEDMIAQVFGTIPVVHTTGGLAKIIDGETGFCYDPDTPEKLDEILSRLIDEIHTDKKDPFEYLRQYMAVYVHSMYDWSTVVKNRYLPLYRRLSAT